jgi:hypothetical protein
MHESTHKAEQSIENLTRINAPLQAFISSSVNPTHILPPHRENLLYALPDAGMEAFDSDKINLFSKQVFQIEREIHEVAEGRLLELYKDIDIAGILLLSSCKGTKEANPLNAETGLISAV